MKDYLGQFFGLPNWVLSVKNLSKWLLGKNLAKFLETAVVAKNFGDLNGAGTIWCNFLTCQIGFF
jgi:hypothetical protein